MFQHREDVNDADQCLMQSVLILMAYRCIDTWPIGAVSQFFFEIDSWISFHT